MATVTCASCAAENDSTEAFCLECSSVLVPAHEPVPPVPADRAAPQPAAPVQPGFEQCPYCGEDVPDPGNLACVECLRAFPTPEKPEAAAPSPADDDARVAGTRRDAVPGVRLRLTFSARGERLGDIEMRPDEELLVGREPASRCAELLAASDNVSRRHAVVGLDGDGAAWVRDEYSTNGTLLNDVPVRAGRRSVLQHGDRLAFGADVVAAVVREEAR
jgi:FHA domain